MFFTALHLVPAALYKQKLQSGELNEDNNQLMVINRLDELAEEAGDYELTKPSVLSKVSECYLTIHPIFLCHLSDKKWWLRSVPQPGPYQCVISGTQK